VRLFYATDEITRLETPSAISQYILVVFSSGYYTLSPKLTGRRKSWKYKLQWRN